MKANKWITYMGLAVLTGALTLTGCKKGSSQTVTSSQESESQTKDAAESVVKSAPAETETNSTAAETAAASLPADMPSAFTFSSGAGGWSTQLELKQDGSFSGSYSDTDMGDVGDDNPNGTMYICNFIGQFVDIQKTGEHTYEMTLEGTQTEDIDDEIVDGVHRVPSDPYGITGGEKFTLYTPDTPLSEIPEDLEGWDPYRFSEGSESRTTIEAYALYNEATGDGFFSDPVE